MGKHESFLAGFSADDSEFIEIPFEEWEKIWNKMIGITETENETPQKHKTEEENEDG